jgi:hypothetical protein
MAARIWPTARLTFGFTVRHGHYLSARWPGDAHRFASEFAAMIALAAPRYARLCDRGRATFSRG